MKSRPAHSIITQAGRFLVVSIFVISGLATSFVHLTPAFADAPKLQHRILQMTTQLEGATSDYTFRFKYQTGNPLIGSLRFDFCTTPYVTETCDAPAGIDTSAATLTTQVGETGFTILSQTASEIIITRPVLQADSSRDITYTFSGIVNPTAVGQFAVRVETYQSTDATTLMNSQSDFAGSIVIAINVNAEVPPFLDFCVAEIIADYCQTSGSNFFDYGDFSDTTTRFSQTQFQVATNARNGYVVVLEGNTLTSSNHLIDALDVPTASAEGSSQFGINLRANSTPAIGQDETGVGIGSINTDYDTPDLFKFAKGDVLASATTGSNYNLFTVSYIVNVPPDLPAGIYNTTVTYVCTGAF